MPKSSKEGKDVILNWMKDYTDILKVLDIGVGRGTYKKLTVKAQLLLDAHWIGIEAWEPYIDLFDLKNMYDVIINQDARVVEYSKLESIDLTIMGDVLEHMTKNESIELVNTIMSNSKYGIISIPIIHFPQGVVNNNPYEEHIKDDWTYQEVLETFGKYIKKSNQGKKLEFFG